MIIKENEMIKIFSISTSLKNIFVWFIMRSVKISFSNLLIFTVVSHQFCFYFFSFKSILFFFLHKKKCKGSRSLEWDRSLLFLKFLIYNESVWVSVRVRVWFSSFSSCMKLFI
jgi:hypothetical protein